MEEDERSGRSGGEGEVCPQMRESASIYRKIEGLVLFTGECFGTVALLRWQLLWTFVLADTVDFCECFWTVAHLTSCWSSLKNTYAVLWYFT